MKSFEYKFLMAKTEKKKKVRELKMELQSLVNAIVQAERVEDEDEEEDDEETYLQLKRVIFELFQFQFKKPLFKDDDDDDLLPYFLCPLSKQVMIDPVIIPNGKTYDRQSIESWLNSGNKTCPHTREPLSNDVNIIPNRLVGEMISKICKKQGNGISGHGDERVVLKGDKNDFDSLLDKLESKTVSEQKQAAKDFRTLTKGMASFRSHFTDNPEAVSQLLAPLSNGSPDSHPGISGHGDERGVLKGDKNDFDSLLDKLESKTVSEQKQAAKDFRTLTKGMASFRSHFTDNPEAVSQLLAPLSNGSPDSHPDIQEDLITTILNASILDDNKKLVAESSVAMSVLVDSLRVGTLATKSNAAAALFTLSALDSNKAIIGDAGALKPLIDLLEEGHPGAMRDASQAIFKLCWNHENKRRAVNDRAVEVILKKLKDGVLVDELLAILALLSVNHKGLEKMIELGAVPYLLNTIKGNSSEHSKENSVAILHLICRSDRTKLKEVREDEIIYGSISQLTMDGSPRAVRKAFVILEKLKNVFVFPTHTA